MSTQNGSHHAKENYLPYEKHVKTSKDSVPAGQIETSPVADPAHQHNTKMPNKSPVHTYHNFTTYKTYVMESINDIIPKEYKSR